MQVYIVTTGVREMSTVGRVYVNTAAMPMPFEVHPLEFELLYLRSGRKQFDFPDHPSVVLSGGEMIVFHPGQVHGNYEAVQTRSTLDYVLVADPEREDTYAFLSQKERETLARRMRQLPRTPFRASKSVRERFESIAELSQDEDLELRAARLRAELILLVMDTLEAAQLADSDMPDDIAEAISYIRENRGEIPSVGELAAMVHLSESRFKQKFKHVTGVPPMEYVIRMKIGLAQEMLGGTPMSVARIAQGVGFSSSQHFCVQFKRYTGLTPTQYRKNALAERGAQVTSIEDYQKNVRVGPEVYGTVE